MSLFLKSLLLPLALSVETPGDTDVVICGRGCAVAAAADDDVAAADGVGSGPPGFISALRGTPSDISY